MTFVNHKGEPKQLPGLKEAPFSTSNPFFRPAVDPLTPVIGPLKAGMGPLRSRI